MRPPAPAECPPVPVACPPVPAECPPVPVACPPVPAECPPVPVACPPVPAACPPVPAACPPVRWRVRLCRRCVRRLRTGGRLQSESRHRRMVDLAGVGQSDRALERSERAPCAPPHGAVDLARVVSSLDERLLDRLDLRVGRRLEHRARTGEHSQQHQRGQQLPRRWHRSRAPGGRWHRSRRRLRRTEDPAHVAELSRIVHCGTAAPVHARSRRPGAPRFSNLRSAHPSSHRAENVACGSGGASATSRARRCACQRRSHSLNSHAMRKVRHR